MTKHYLLLLILFISSTANSQSQAGIPHYIQAAAVHFNVDPALMYAMCKVESMCIAKTINRNDGNKAQKAKGIISRSHGLFQLKLATARGLGFKGTSTELLAPGVNSYYAAKYVRYIYDKYGHDTVRAISIYNAGHYTNSNAHHVTKVLRAYARIKLDKRS